MEDDQHEKEDDRKLRKDDCGQEAVKKDDRRKVSPYRMVSEKRLGSRPPPPRSMSPQSDGVQVPDTAGVLYPVSTKGVIPSTGSTRAADSDRTNSTEECVQRESLDNRKTGFVTVNGVNMMVLLKMEKDPMKKMNVTGRNSPRGRRKKCEEETPSSGKTSNYFTMMIVEEEEHVTR